jgi:hypothetical protein
VTIEPTYVAALERVATERALDMARLRTENAALRAAVGAALAAQSSGVFTAQLSVLETMRRLANEFGIKF